MLVFNLYVFNKKGECLYYEQWNRENVPSNLVEEQKLMYGLLFSLKSFASKTSPVENDRLLYLRTSAYKMHFFESLSGVKFILLTDPGAGNLGSSLEEIFRIYVEYCSKNPLYEIGTPINCDLFAKNLQTVITKLQAST
mmetsp:Transcript_23726/g.66524  ORF Transcript_23726/g.66524 Transcript_23726/m.66524 type:complete len:139 (+) Transcript_23726:154-570(+)